MKVDVQQGIDVAMKWRGRWDKMADYERPETEGNDAMK